MSAGVLLPPPLFPPPPLEPRSGPHSAGRRASTIIARPGAAMITDIASPDQLTVKADGQMKVLTTLPPESLATAQR